MTERRRGIEREKAGTDSPGLFLHRLSFDEGLVCLLPTDAARLREATFLDERTDFSAGPPALIAMDTVLRETLGPSPDRFIFHVGFCGSTLLSRLLESPGRSLVLREPQGLSDLAARRTMLDQSGGEDPRVDAMISRIPGLLSRRWHDGETVTIKPSNWANNLAPALCAAERPVLPLFLTASPRAFLRAVFRGGSERIGFAARAAVHFSAAGRDNAEQVARALGDNAEQTVKLARLAALAFRMQSDFFRSVTLAGNWGAERTIDFETFSGSPIDTAIEAARLLDLDLPADIIAANAKIWLPRDAKQPSSDFSAEARQSLDDSVDEMFGSAIDDALAWAHAD